MMSSADNNTILISSSPPDGLSPQGEASQVIPASLIGTWWVAHTKPRQEKALARDLENLGIFCYLPLRTNSTRSRRTGRLSRALVPLFQGYLFLNATEAQRQSALTTNRIVTTLGVPDQKELVHQLRQIHGILQTDVDYKRNNGVIVGDWVRVVAGVLMGLEGVVYQRRSQFRLAVNIHTLGQSVSVEIAEEHLQRIDPPYSASQSQLRRSVERGGRANGLGNRGG